MVHRVALAEKLGRPIRPGMKALHHCDNPPCHEPEHIYEGTSAQNNQDTIERGRWRGPASRPAIDESLKEAIVRRYVTDGASFDEVAAEFGIGASSVNRLVPRDQHRPVGMRGQSPQVIEAICRKYAAGGVTQLALAREFGLATGTISRIISMNSAKSA
jgi:transposase-like protein